LPLSRSLWNLLFQPGGRMSTPVAQFFPAASAPALLLLLLLLLDGFGERLACFLGGGGSLSAADDLRHMLGFLPLFYEPADARHDRSSLLGLGFFAANRLVDHHAGALSALRVDEVAQAGIRRLRRVCTRLNWSA